MSERFKCLGIVALLNGACAVLNLVLWLTNGHSSISAFGGGLSLGVTIWLLTLLTTG